MNNQELKAVQGLYDVVMSNDNVVDSMTKVSKVLNDHYKNNETVCAIVNKGDIFIEDFIDEDTGDVVSIERFLIKDTYIVKFYIPNCKFKADKLNAAELYLSLYFRDYRIVDIITSNKYEKIKNKEIKKYLNVEPHIMIER